MTEYAGLKEAAEKARDLSADHQTPGVWMYLFGDRFVYTRLEDGCRGRSVVGVDYPRSDADSAALVYVGKANPATILALIAENEAQAAAIRDLQAENAKLIALLDSIITGDAT